MDNRQTTSIDRIIMPISMIVVVVGVGIAYGVLTTKVEMSQEQMRQVIAMRKDDLVNLTAWREEATTRLARIEAKLETLLEQRSRP